MKREKSNGGKDKEKQFTTSFKSKWTTWIAKGDLLAYN
jgi:hypothetical protein